MAGALFPAETHGTASLHALQGEAKSRPAASVELLWNEATHNITGKDWVGDTVQGAINSFRTIVQAGLEIGPAIVHTVTGQKFYVQRRDGVLDATHAAFKSIGSELQQGHLVSAAYTTVAELLPDAPARDLLQTDSIIVAADHP